METVLIHADVALGVRSLTNTYQNTRGTHPHGNTFRDADCVQLDPTRVERAL